MMIKSKLMAGSALTALALCPALAAHAQAAASGGAVSDVVVTATKTGSTNLQKTPLSVDVIGAADLKKEGVETFRDLELQVPSLKFQINGNQVRIFIRGVGGYNANDGDVSLYLDGVFLARPTVATQATFNDLDRIEVVEGPQGTLFGRNSTGGAVNFVSKTPSKTFTFTNTLSLGNFALIDEQASVSGPIADNMQASLAFTHFRHNGYLHNAVPGAGDGDTANRTGVRGQLRWEATPDITNTLRADYIYTNEYWQTANVPVANVSNGVVGAFNFAPLFVSHVNDLRTIVYSQNPFNHEQAYGVSDEFLWKLNDNLTIKALSAGRTDQSIEGQGGPTEVLYGGGPQDYYEYQISEEFTLIHNFGPISGVAGLYYYYDHNYYQVFAANPGGNAKVPAPSAGSVTGQNTFDPTVSRAAFLEETYHITPTLSVTAGARYTQEQKGLNTFNFSYVYWPGNPANLQVPSVALGFPANYTIPPTPETFSADIVYNAHALTPKFGVNWQATPDILTYATVTNGYKSGGFNETGRAIGPALFYGPENMWAYEAGVRSDWFDHTLRVNLSLFRYQWYGLQFKASIGPSTVSTSNAGNARTNGLEATINYKPAPGLTIDLHATVLDAKYVSFPAYSYPSDFTPYLNPAKVIVTPGGKVTNVSGNTLVDAPPLALSLAVQKDFDLADGADVFLRGEYQYTGKMYFDPTNLPQAGQAPYSVVNGSIGYSPAHSHWTVSLWGKNMTDARYFVGNQAATIWAGAVGDPRTFGVRINYTY